MFPAAIKTVDIGNRVFEVRENAFAGCSAIKNVNYIGSKAGFDAVAIYKGNDGFKAAKLNIIAPSADGVVDQIEDSISAPEGLGIDSKKKFQRVSYFC